MQAEIRLTTGVIEVKKRLAVSLRSDADAIGNSSLNVASFTKCLKTEGP